MAEYFAAIATALESVFSIKKYVLTPIVHQFSYLCCYNSYTECLRSQVEKLNQKRHGVQLRVEADRRNLQTIGQEVQIWLDDVEKINIKYGRICSATGDVQQGCLRGWCPNVKQRYFLSREAKEAYEAAVQLIETVEKLTISYPPNLEPIPPASGTEFDSRKSKEEEIMNALKDNSVHMIGVCGMGGIGKTTMVKIIEERVREGKIFGEVVMAVVSQQPNLKTVQQEIAEGLELEVKEDSIPNRARRLHNRLKTAKTILIILDDVWEKMNLNELGIPSPSTHEGCKIMLTSRVQHVCKEMDPNAKIVTLEVLPEAEAWNLFREKAGDSVESNDLYETAKKVAKECRGLPLALVTLGSALRGGIKCSWEDALTQLQRSKIPTNIPAVLEDVYTPLRWSYDNFRSLESRYLFLLCCLFPEDYDIPIEHLVGYSLHAFRDVQNLREARNRVCACIESLKNRFLLINGNDKKNESVKMHDVIRDMAMYIASQGEHVFLVSHDKNLNKWPQRDSYESYTCISLEFKKIVDLPERINCPRLEVLHISYIYGQVIPENFFDGMESLKVLDVKGWELSVPSSLGVLKNLRTLFLHRCILNKPSIIGQLVNLEILSLKGSIIEVMLVEFGGLRKLRLLDVTNCKYLGEIEAGAIPGLVQLEELLMVGCLSLKGANEKGDSPVHLHRYLSASLSTLVHLEIAIPNLKAIPRDLLHWRKLTSYVMIIGEASDGSRHMTESRRKNVNFRSSKVIHLPEWVYAMSRDAQGLRLVGKGSSDVIRNVGSTGFQNVKMLSAFQCTEVAYLVDAAFHGSRTSVVFPVIESLHVNRCGDLKKIYHGRSLSAGSFGALREIRIEYCKSLQYVFPLSVAESLSQLQQLTLCDCAVMEEVFKEKGEEGLIRSIKFPKLHKLMFIYLPSLNGFCNGNIDGIEFPSLLSLEILCSPNLTNFCSKESSCIPGLGDQFLFNQQVTFTSLKTLTINNLNAVTKLFGPEIHSGYMSSLKYLKIDSCQGLRSLFSPFMIRGLTNLKMLDINNCQMLQEVIADEAKEGQTNIKEIFFPQLKELMLWKLPKILSFCLLNDYRMEFSSLENLTISDCPMMETFSMGTSTKLTFKPDIGSVSETSLAVRPFFSKEVSFTSLKTLTINNLNVVTELFGLEIHMGYMSSLEYLEIDSCQVLRTVFSPYMIRGLTNLKKLKIKDCQMLQEVIADEAKEGQTNIKEIFFPQLKELMLQKLPKVLSFYHLNEFPSLEMMTIIDCPMMETFSMGSNSKLTFEPDI